MSEKDKRTNEPEVKEVQAEETVENTPKQPENTEEKPKAETEQTMGEVLETAPKEKSEKPDSVPLAALEMSRKEARRAKEQAETLQKEINALKESNETPQDLKDTYSKLASEYNVDPTFIQKLAQGLETNIEARLKDQVEDKFKPFTEKERLAEQSAKFDKFYKSAIAGLPEYKKIANKEIIKTLAFQPNNANKTISQLIESVYGNAIGGKETIEATTKPGGGKEPKSIDFQKAKSDPAYFKEVMSDPATKKEYNDSIESRIDW